MQTTYECATLRGYRSTPAAREEMHTGMTEGRTRPNDGPMPQVGALTAPVDVPLVGRERELALLEALVTQAGEGRGRIALVSGEAGIGKTRLVNELRRANHAGPAWFVTGSAFPDDASVAFGPLAESLRDARRRHPALWEAARARSAPLSAIAPELGGEAGYGRAGAPADLPVLFEALLDAVEEACTDGPCVWVLEDLHSADASTWQFVKHTIRRISELPLVLIATYREDEVGPRHAWWQRLVSVGSRGEVEVVRLARLTEEETSALVAMLAPALSEQEARDVGLRSAGTPLFVEELAALVAASGGPLPPLPEIVRVTFLDRAGRLSALGREFLDVVAVAGSDAEDDLFLSLDLPPFDEPLAECQSVGLVLRRDDGVTFFRHPLLLDAAYLAVAPSRRARLHRQVGEALAERGTSTAERVARHVERAGRPAQALEALEAATRDARQVGNVGRAASLIQMTVDLARRHPGLGRSVEELELVAIGDMFSAGRWTDLDPLIRGRWSERQLLEPRERAWLAGVFVLHLFWTGSMSEADAVGQQEIVHLEQTGHLEIGAMLLAQTAFIAWFRGDGQRALTVGRRAIEIAGVAGDAEAECRASNAVANATFQLDHDRVAAAQSHWENARFARARGLAVAEANALWSASHFIATMESYEAAERAAERAGTWYAEPARVWKGMLHVIEGTPDEAEAIFVRVGSQIRNGVPAMAGWMDTVEAWLFLHRGDLEEARRLLNGSAGRSEAAHLTVWADQRSAAEGWLAWEEGRWADAADWLGKAEEECGRGGYHLTVGGPILLPLHVDALLRLRRRSQAESLIERVRHAYPAPDRFFDASAAAATFRLRPTAPSAAEAIRHADDAPWPWLAAHILCWKGELLRDRRAIGAARECFERLDAHAGLRRTDAVLAALSGRAIPGRTPVSGLSARELEIAGLIASGMTNPAISRRLHLSRPTVASHVAHILTKLGFSSRAQVAAWFADQQASRDDGESST